MSGNQPEPEPDNQVFDLQDTHSDYFEKSHDASNVEHRGPAPDDRDD